VAEPDDWDAPRECDLGVYVSARRGSDVLTEVHDGGYAVRTKLDVLLTTLEIVWSHHPSIARRLAPPTETSHKRSRSRGRVRFQLARVAKRVLAIWLPSM
jgi:hypothetical protein